jgi:hypothetical protein
MGGHACPLQHCHPAQADHHSKPEENASGASAPSGSNDRELGIGDLEIIAHGSICRAGFAAVAVFIIDRGWVAVG